MIRELGENYVSQLREVYSGRVSGGADLVCFWFAKAWNQIAKGKCRFAGLVATNAIRKGANRTVLDSITKNGFIFEAWSDRPWILEGAAVRVSFICFSNSKISTANLDGEVVTSINADLTGAGENETTDLTKVRTLETNAEISFQGSQKIGAFDISLEKAREWLVSPNAHGLPNSDVIKPSWNGVDLTRRPRDGWIIDFGTNISQERAALYEKPFQFVLENVKPERDQNNREMYRKFWWRHGEPRIAMRENLFRLNRFIATSEVAKHRTFAWLPIEILPDKRLIVFARQDDAAFGILQSCLHEVWSLKLGSTLEDRPCYRPTTCFETFPFPRPTPKQEAAIAAAAKELNALRERWLNPPEWTQTSTLEFRGTVGGAWSRYIDAKTVEEVILPGQDDLPEKDRQKIHVGTVRYPRLEPRDADCAALLKKRTLTNLYNERPAWLDLAHKKLDVAVAVAYGWVHAGQATVDLSDEAILEKLLALNLERAAEEAKAAKGKKPKAQREKQADEMV